MAENQETTKQSYKPIWGGSITIGLVNVPIKIYTMIRDQAFSFRLLHDDDGQPLKYERICTGDNKVVDWKDTVKGYEIQKNEFIVFKKEELDAIRPESDRKIKLDKFVSLLSIDPVYFNKSYLLVPDGSEEAYSLLMSAIRQMGKAGLGKITLRTKEYPVVVYEYKGVLIMTTLRYANEIVIPESVGEELTKIKKPSQKEMELAVKIINELSGEFDITRYRDGYREKMEELIESKIKGEAVVVREPEKEEIKELMVALQETIKKLKK
ncbi:MAG: Ku protein [Candidatus Methanoperedens sp.]|nr:Ku protein [Candidatus Methanoperedens sp.]